MNTPPERKRKTKDPCVVCGLSPQRCICGTFTPLNTTTRLSLVIHHRELKRTTNTGRLAVAALANSRMIVRGQLEAPVSLSALLEPEYQSVLLYPADDARELNEVRFDRPVQLIVADGNWRQAAKVGLRHRELDSVPRVKISTPNTSSVHLRREHFPAGYSTLEAIALAFGILEGEEIERHLRAIYETKLRATLNARGQRIN